MGLYQDILESSDGAAFINLRDSAGGGITSTLNGGKQSLDVNVANSISITDANTASILALMNPSSAAMSSVAVSGTSASLLPANPGRKGWSVFNDTNGIIYIAMGATSSVSAYSVRLASNAYYESLSQRVYTGVISVIGANGSSGNATVSEYS